MKIDTQYSQPEAIIIAPQENQQNTEPQIAIIAHQPAPGNRFVICYLGDTVVDIASESLMENVLLSARTASNNFLHNTGQFISARIDLVKHTLDDIIDMFGDLFSDKTALRENLVASSLLLYGSIIFSIILCALDSDLDGISFFKFPLMAASIPMLIAFVI